MRKGLHITTHHCDGNAALYLHDSQDKRHWIQADTEEMCQNAPAGHLLPGLSANLTPSPHSAACR